jgi:hypothetical protein
MEFNQHTLELALAFMWALSELLGESKVVAANSVYGLFKGILKSILNK